ncbi:MAG: hypothetical protein K8M05_14000 [Deltaproteobacteria bacterium]|nr:hypothetical protein [Kofleriaceae bacterium]
MKRIVLAALVLAFAASCKKTECPTCPTAEKCPPPPAPCPEASCDIKLDDGSTAAAWRLVHQDGKAFLTTTLADKRVIAVPVTETTQILIDGQQATGGETLRPGGGSCPCQLPQCLPYCRPIGSVLSPPQP